MSPDELFTCEAFVARLRAELDELCEDWNVTRRKEPQACPEKMTLSDWMIHLGTRFPDFGRED